MAHIDSHTLCTADTGGTKRKIDTPEWNQLRDSTATRVSTFPPTIPRNVILHEVDSATDRLPDLANGPDDTRNGFAILQ